MQGWAWLWDLGAGMIAGVTLIFAAWSAAVRSRS